MVKKRGIGVMIGSSLDGIDLADCSFVYDDNIVVDWQMNEFASADLTDEIKTSILNFKDLNQSEINILESDIAKNVVSAVQLHFSEVLSEIEFIGLHGITVLHKPENSISIQLGDASLISDALQLAVISNFRMADILQGGVGTPMAPIVEKYLFPHYDYFLNLGGIANLSIQEDHKFIAFDVCPFNQVLNYYAGQLNHEFDEGGAIARKGKYIEQIVQQLSAKPFFKKAPPKSLDNNWIREAFIPEMDAFGLSPEDALASMIQFAVRCIDNAITKRGLERSILITGGGAYNLFFIEQLENMLSQKSVAIHIPDKNIIEGKESILMAFAAFLRLIEIPNFIPSVTGAKHAVCGGDIFIPS